MKFYLLFIVCFVCAISKAQIHGIVAENSGNLLAGVSVTLQQKNKQTILAYAISDNSGKFEIVFSPDKKDSFQLKAALLGYGKQSISFVWGQQTDFNFTLSPETKYLPEIKIKTLPVWQRKDTLNYNTSEFKRPQDRVIGDIIARLPGIEVTPGGQIRYQGKPINKYYIEGLDLLEDKYGIANNNLPADAVERVQVLENHQPIRVLDTVSFSDRAAINIKLTNAAKLRLLGTAKLGLGAAPLLSEDELSLLLFKKKIQFINTYKYNNTGVDNARDLTSQNRTEYSNGIENGSNNSGLLSLIKPQNPSINKNRYLFNNAHTASLNLLIPVNKKYQLRVNAAYINDYQQQESENNTRIYINTDTIVINESNQYKYLLNRFDFDAALIANTPSYYLKNNLRIKVWQPEGHSNILGTTAIQQSLLSQFYNISNDLRLIKIKKKNIIEYASYAGLARLPENLNIKPGLYSSLLNNNQPYDAIIQKVKSNNFYTDNYISLRRKRSKWGSQYKAGFNIQDQELSSNLQTENAGLTKSIADTFQNNLNWQRLRLYTEASWLYETGKVRLSLSIPVNFINIHFEDTAFSLLQKRNAMLTNPNASIIVQINQKWSISANSSYTTDFGNIQSINNGYILKTYRNLSKNNTELPKNTSTSTNVNVTYKNPIKIIFINGGASFYQNKSNLLYKQSFDGILETLLADVKDNISNDVSFYGRINKYIIDWKTSLTFNADYGFGKSQLLQNDVLTKFTNKNSSFSTSVNSKLSYKFNIEYSGTVQSFTSINNTNKNNISFKNFKQSLSVNYIISEQLFFKIAAEQYSINSIRSTQNYFFGDASVRLKPKKTRVDYELFLQNLFNTKNFSSATLADNSAFISEYKIRPRQIIFKVSFSLQ